MSVKNQKEKKIYFNILCPNRQIREAIRSILDYQVSKRNLNNNLREGSIHKLQNWEVLLSILKEIK